MYHRAPLCFLALRPTIVHALPMSGFARRVCHRAAFPEQEPSVKCGRGLKLRPSDVLWVVRYKRYDSAARAPDARLSGLNTSTAPPALKGLTARSDVLSCPRILQPPNRYRSPVWRYPVEGARVPSNAVVRRLPAKPHQLPLSPRTPLLRSSLPDPCPSSGMLSASLSSSLRQPLGSERRQRVSARLPAQLARRQHQPCYSCPA